MDTQTNTALQVDPGVPVITEALFNRLTMMIQSSDPVDHSIAQHILTTVDVKESIYWIWRLARINVNRMVNLRTKSGRKFRDDSNLFYISTKSEAGFAKYLLHTELMTPKIYQIVKEFIIEDITKLCNSPFFKFTFELNDKFKHLDPDSLPVEFKNDNT
jgi:hypothetical protein